ncbi:hypothetical protein IWB18_10550 [Alkalibacter sp. M17DMB]|nr:hypothetical protein [Alkalibacter mobilis]
MGNAVTINTNRASTSFTHTISYSFGTASGTIATGVGASYAWTVPLSLVSAISGSSGTCTITLKTYSGATLVGTKTATMTLVKPAVTTPTVNYSAREMGQIIRVTTNPSNSALSHKIYYAFTGISKTLLNTTASGNTYYDWTIPLATLAPKIPNNTSGTVTVYADTYYGSTLIGSKTVTFTATVPSSVVPTVSISKTGVSLYNGYYVQNKSKVSVTLSDSGSYGSTISSRKTTINGATYTTASFTTGVLTGAGTNTITTTVTDSRGRTKTTSTTITVTAYANPQATSLTAIRSNSDGTANPQGAYMKLTGSAVISSINNTNTKSTYIRYRPTGGSWTTAASDAVNYTPSLSAVVPADVNSTFEVELVAADYYSSATRATTVSTAFVLMDFHSSGMSMAIGKVAEGKGVLDINGDVWFGGNQMNTDLVHPLELDWYSMESLNGEIRITLPFKADTKNIYLVNFGAIPNPAGSSLYWNTVTGVLSVPVTYNGSAVVSRPKFTTLASHNSTMTLTVTALARKTDGTLVTEVAGGNEAINSTLVLSITGFGSNYPTLAARLPRLKLKRIL